MPLTGTAIGLVGAGMLTRTMKTMLFNVSPTDPEIFVGIAVVFLTARLSYQSDTNQFMVLA